MSDDVGIERCRRCGEEGTAGERYCQTCRAHVEEQDAEWSAAGQQLVTALAQRGHPGESRELIRLLGREATAEPRGDDADSSGSPGILVRRAALLGALVASGEPVAVAAIAAALRCTEADVERALEDLARFLSEHDTGLRIERRRAGVEVTTIEEIASVVREVRRIRAPRTLTPIAKETLFIIMRRGRACTKAEIAEVRGPSRRGDAIDVGPVLKTLRREGLVTRAGVREDAPGRPTLYVATKKARERFLDLERAIADLLGQPVW